MYYLYKIINTINQKVYIGQTNNPSLRWSQHKSNAKYDRGNQVITRALTKYGSNVFTFEVIAMCLTQLDTDTVEEQLIQQYDSRNPQKGYNISAGGNTTPRTPEMLAKISNSLQKFYKTHDGWLKGKTLPKDWKDNISQSHIGLPGTNTGKKFDTEWKINISKSRAGKLQKHNRRFSEEIEKEICRLYVVEMKSAYTLGKQFDCPSTTISNIIIRNDIEIRQSNYTGHSNGKNIFSLQQEIEICAKYLSGNISRSELSKQYNCGKTTIRNILLKHKIKL